MSSLALQVDPRAEQVQCTDDELVVSLTDGRTLSVPLAWFPRLVNASAQQRAQYELLGDGNGIHWPAIDEDISILGILAGTPAVDADPAAPNKSLQPIARGTRSG